MAGIWVPARMFRDWWPKAAALPKRSKSLKALPEKSWNPAGNTAIRPHACSGARFGRSANSAFLFLSLKWDASQDFPTGKLPAVSERLAPFRRHGEAHAARDSPRRCNQRERLAHSLSIAVLC